jgi:Caspase domain
VSRSSVIRLSNIKRPRRLFLVLFSAVVVLIFQPLTLPQSEAPAAVFELELPDFQMLPSSRTEITVPSSNVSQVLIHILKPVADNIDYSAIRTSVNGQAAATISEIVSGVRGKIVKMNLKLQPGYQFVNGRNTVEVWAQNRRGRMYYSSFIIKTATANWNEDFTYHIEQSPEARNTVPPQLVLFEPERAIEFPSKLKSLLVKISGFASGATAVKRVSVDGKNVQLKAGQEIATRQLTRLGNFERSVAFETSTTIGPNTTQIVVEAEDNAGSRTQVVVPVFITKPGVTTQLSGRKYALVIGISKYKNNLRGVPNLEYADVDARSIYEFLQQPAAGGFSREDMLMLVNEEATNAGIRQALTNFIAKASADDLLLIFFAGHGAPDPSAPQNLYLIAYDTSVEDMSETALAMSDLRRYIEQNIKSKRVVLLLDACHSAGLSADVTRDLGNNLANLYLEKLLYQDEGRAIITSSDVNEPSHESQRWGNGHGVFTYYLLQGLKGSADTNQDRLVTVGELFRYVRQKVRLDTQFLQNPRMLIGDNENLALAVARSH